MPRNSSNDQNYKLQELKIVEGLSKSSHLKNKVQVTQLRGERKNLRTLQPKSHNVKVWWAYIKNSEQINCTLPWVIPQALHPSKSKAQHCQGNRQSPKSLLRNHQDSSIWWRVMSTDGGLWGGRQRMDKDRDLHAIVALPIATNEVIPLGLIEGDEVFATAPVPNCTVQGAVVIPCLVHFEHIVLVLLVPKRCNLTNTTLWEQKTWINKKNLHKR